MIAIIGGSGLYHIPEFRVDEVLNINSPFSEVPVYVEKCSYDGKALYFLPRHGKEHTLPPHRINYRANIDALVSLGVKNILALSTVGGIGEDFEPGTYCLPHQIVDYTWGREHTFADVLDSNINHIDFTSPFSAKVRSIFIESANRLSLSLKRGCYGCTQGPRLETAAEIRRLRNDGCDVVGMTLMPEAALARERSLEYAAVSLVVNWAAGVGESHINLKDIEKTFELHVPRLRQLLLESVKLF